MTLRNFWEKYRNYIFMIGIFSFLIHGAKLHSEIIGIDTEDLIHLQKDFYTGWAETGRYGLVFLKYLFHNLQFQPYFTGLTTLLFLTIGVFSFAWLWSEISGKKHWGILLGAFLWISHPIMTEQLYFSLQSMEICMGIALTAGALYLTKYFGENRKWYCFAGSVTLLLITFSMYQIFVPFYIFGTTTIVLLQALEVKHEHKEMESIVADNAWKRLINDLLPYLGVFFVAFLGNTLITNLCFAKSDYLGRQILWGSVPVAENIMSIGGHVFKTLTGYEVIHYHFSYGLLVVLAFILVTRHVFQKVPKGSRAVTLFYFFGVLAAPYLLVIICGSATVIRSQLILPASTAFFVYLNERMLEERWRVSGEKNGEVHCLAAYKNILQKPAVYILILCFSVAVVAGCWNQTYTTEALYYTDRCRYEQDAALGRELILRIEQVRGDEDYPVVVIGSKEFDANNSNVVGETIGQSMFDYDTKVEPEYFWSTKRILGFLHTLGKEYPQVGLEQMPEAYTYSENMPQWPEQGCVQVINDMVVVKLEVE